MGAVVYTALPNLRAARQWKCGNTDGGPAVKRDALVLYPIRVQSMLL